MSDLKAPCDMKPPPLILLEVRGKDLSFWDIIDKEKAKVGPKSFALDKRSKKRDILLKRNKKRRIHKVEKKLIQIAKDLKG